MTQARAESAAKTLLGEDHPLVVQAAGITDFNWLALIEAVRKTVEAFIPVFVKQS